MLLRIPRDQLTRVRDALIAAGGREIGGQLYGEQLAPSEFRATAIAIQRRRGSWARFFVDLLQAGRDAARFFDQTGHRYSRFNYIGEWHSHPSFSVHPSTTDIGTMTSLVNDPEFQGSFAILMIVKRNDKGVECGAWVFNTSDVPAPVTLELEA